MVLIALGLFLFGIAYSTREACVQQHSTFYCNGSYGGGVPWSIPLEIGGGATAFVGIGLVVASFSALKTSEPTASSETGPDAAGAGGGS